MTVVSVVGDQKLKCACLKQNPKGQMHRIQHLWETVCIFTCSQEADGVSLLSHHGDWAGEGVSDQYSLGFSASQYPPWVPTIKQSQIMATVDWFWFRNLATFVVVALMWADILPSCFLHPVAGSTQMKAYNWLDLGLFCQRAPRNQLILHWLPVLWPPPSHHTGNLATKFWKK